MKNKTNIFIYLGVLIVFIMTSVFGYYVNIHNFFDQSRTDDTNDGFGQKRNISDFIEDGCGTDTILDVVTGFCWDKNFNRTGKKNWTDAKTYCNVLSLGENTDWYLPTNNELSTLINEIGESGSTCSTLESFGFTNCQDDEYWSNQEYKNASYKF